MKTKPIPPYATLPSSGIDVEWSELMKGWKIDMGMDVQGFFKKNPDIFQAIQKRLPDLDLANVSTRDILKRGVAEEILRQLIIETDIPGEADRIFKGQRLRSVATGTLTAEARNKIYERAFERGQLPQGTSINPEGGVRHASVLDGDYDGPYYDHTQLPKGKEGHIRKKYQKLWRDQAKTGNTSQINFWVDPKTNLEVPKGTQGAVGFRVHATKRSKTHASGWETPGIKRQTYGDTAERKLDIRSQTAPEYLTPQGKKAYNRLWDQLNAQGLEVHHTIPLHRARGMFQGLDSAAKTQLIKDWEKVGVRFGNVEGAVQGFTKADHDAIHRTYESMDAAIAKAGKTHPSILNEDKIKTGSTFFDDLWELEAPARHRALLKNTKLLRSIGGYTGKAEAAARLAAGDYVGGGIGLALQTKPVQTQIAKRLAKLSSKAIPGVGMTLGSMETAGYATQGRWTQSGIAAFGTAFSEVPVAGDIIQGAADLTNLGIDIFTGNLVPSTDETEYKTRRPDVDAIESGLPISYKRSLNNLNSAIGNTDLNWRPTRFLGIFK